MYMDYLYVITIISAAVPVGMSIFRLLVSDMSRREACAPAVLKLGATRGRVRY